MQRRGPLVHPSVHYGAFAVAGSAIAIIVGILFAALSSLNTSATLTQLGSGGGSLWAIVFDAALVIGGALGILGTFLLWSAFPQRSSRTLGLGALIGSFVGALGFGAFPAGTWWGNSGAHTAFVWIFFVLIVVALLFLSLAMLRDTRWTGYRLYTLLSALVSLVGLLLTYLGAYGPVGALRIQLVLVAPWLVWCLVVGIHLARVEVLPRSAVKRA